MSVIFTMNASPYFSSAKAARLTRFFRAHKRLIAFTLVLAYAAFLLIEPIIDPRSDELYDGAVYLFLLASQLFWIRRVRDLGKRLIASQRWRKALGTSGLIVYLFPWAFILMFDVDNEKTRAQLTMQTALVGMPFSVWIWVRSSVSWSSWYFGLPIASRARPVGPSRS